MTDHYGIGGKNMVELLYNADQLLLILTIILICVFAYLGETSDRKDYLRRGLYFMFTFILCLFSGAYIAQMYEWYLPFTLMSISGFYALRGFINLGMVKRFRNA
jgi:hypothetical protein